MIYKKPIHVCHRCLTAEQRVGKDWRCPNDGEPITHHAAEKYCPLGKYRVGPGDVLARIFYRTGIRRIVARWSIITGKQCDCKGTQIAINNSWEKLLRRWFGSKPNPPAE